MNRSGRSGKPAERDANPAGNDRLRRGVCTTPGAVVEKEGDWWGWSNNRAVGKLGELHMTILSGVIGGADRVTAPEARHDGEAPLARSHGMDGIREFLSAVRDAGIVAGHFRGLLHAAIGRKITRPDGSTLSAGVTWRELAAELKHLRFDTELVREFGTDPETLAARDRERFWYSAIAAARVDSAEAVAEADRLAPRLKSLGFVVGPPPTGAAPPPARPKPEPKAREKEKETKPAKKKKK